MSTSIAARLVGTGALVLGLVASIACGSKGDGAGSGFPDGGEGSTAGSTAGSTSGSTAGNTAGSTSGSTSGNTAGNTGGATSGDFGDAGEGTTGGQTCAATTAEAQKASVDIIIIVDTSGSMDSETAQVKANINTFAGKIGQSGLDYQVIMIAASGNGTYQICVAPPLGGASCADNPPTFHHINKTVASTNALSLLLSTYDTSWKQFARPDAYKSFVVITDDNSKLSSTDFDTQLLAKAPAGMFGTAQNRKYIVNSICGWSDGTPILSPTKCSTAVNTGSVYQELSKLTSGVVDSVCKTSFAGVFDNLAKGLVAKVGCEFAVPKPDGGTTDPDKVVVQFTPSGGAANKLTRVTDPSKCAATPNAWYYDDNTSPTKILLCPTTCTAIGSGAAGKIEALLGCQAPKPT